MWWYGRVSVSPHSLDIYGFGEDNTSFGMILQSLFLHVFTNIWKDRWDPIFQNYMATCGARHEK